VYKDVDHAFPGSITRQIMLLNVVNHEKINIYTKDLNGIGLSVNESVVKSFGLCSAADYIGMTDMDLPGQDNYAPAWIENDRRVMSTGEAEILLEVCNCAGTIQWFRSYKSPLLGNSGKVIGIMGISLQISAMSLISITPQQTICLRQLALGLTHKQIGQALGLSQKTVEHYLDAVKMKLNCKSRSELILQAIERGLIGFM
jgi:DNA-binding CsgD family transcriptional regulator